LEVAFVCRGGVRLTLCTFKEQHISLTRTRGLTNRELIARMEAKTKAKLAEVWGEEADGGKQPR
jgi:hypothetical protein